MKALNSLVRTLDNYQRKHRLTGFIYAVIKKYGEDQAGYKAALLTYYAFLSLFPLLLVLTTLTDSLSNGHSELHASITKSISDYFPLLGSQLSSHVQGLHQSGLALLIGILFTLYGARGVADVFCLAVQDIWRVPKTKRSGFPKSALRSLSIIVVGGLGFLLASIIAGLAAGVGHGLGFRLLSIGINLFILFWLFTFLLNTCLPRHVSAKQVRAGAASAAIGLLILQALGGYLLARELKSLDALYSYFAIALGLLFWMYLQAQLLVYSIEIAHVSAKRLWPRSLNNHSPTEADTQLQP